MCFILEILCGSELNTHENTLLWLHMQSMREYRNFYERSEDKDQE